MGTFGVAAAEQRDPTTAPRTNYAELEQLYRLRQSQVRSLDEMLKRDERRSLEVEKLIAYAKTKGKDTAALEKALATYRTMLRYARASWQTAADVLKTHAGFNDAGKVTNLDKARATLKTAETAIYKCYRVARDAEELLNKALAEFRGKK
jgi:hypothetical protein